ncbi:MAG: transketolase [Bacilli bacterium]|nr:transketolase [Bacilli bacterium]
MNNLEQIAKEIRILNVKCIESIGAGHIGGSLSIVDVLTALYYKEMNIDPKNPKKEGRDRLVVSKGHAGPGVYATLCHKGYFEEKELYTLNKYGTNLPSHCDMNKTPGVDMTTGSLGQGLSCAIGLAVGSKIKKDNATIYAIIGDGESQEGQIWEGAFFASHKKLDNLIVFLDYNRMQLDGYLEEINDSGNMVDKFKSFGFDTYSIDGHNIDLICETIEKAKTVKGAPHMIVLNTTKGKGVEFAEKAGPNCHSMPISKEALEEAIKGLK